MSFARFGLALTFSLLMFSWAFCQQVAPVVDSVVNSVAPPKTLAIDGAGLARLRSMLDSQPGVSATVEVTPALDQLIEEAKESLTEGPWTVVSKKWTPPSGDKHDYMSVGPYWWPNPETKDGLPYIRRDGEVNPERMEYDNVGLVQTANNSLTLALAWYFTGEAKYAQHSARLLRGWFLHPDTRMNPNLNFGQAIPGRSEGRGIGIIDTTGLIRVVDAALILEQSQAWSKDDAEGLRNWFGQYLDWLQHSPNGIDESRTRNNHATWYDAQVGCFALYAGQVDVARQALGESAKRRIDSQIRPDGTMPHELARTKSWSYSTMNLRGFFMLAVLAEHVEVDLWNYQSESGGSLRGALDYLVPYATGEKAWPHQQISEFHGSSLASALHDASRAYDSDQYKHALTRASSPNDLAQSRFQLTRFVAERAR